MPRRPPGMHPFAQSGRGGPGSQAVRRLVPTDVFAYRRTVARIPLTGGQAQAVLSSAPVATPFAVTATASGANSFNGLALTVSVLTGAAAVQAGATASGSVSPPQVTITPNATGSLIFGAILDDVSSTPMVPLATTVFNQQFIDGVHGSVYGTFVSAGPTTISVPVTVGSTTPVAAQDVAAAEIEPAGLSTLAIDGSTPAPVGTASALTVSTALFDPPGGSLLVAQVASDFNGAGAITMAVTGGGLTWTQLVASPNHVASVWIATVPATSGQGRLSVTPQGLGTVWYPAQCTISTTSGVLDTSTFNLYLGPAGVPVTLVGTLFPGGAGTIALAIPPLTPGQALIGVWTGGKVGDVASMNVIGEMDAVTT